MVHLQLNVDLWPVFSIYYADRTCSHLAKESPEDLQRRKLQFVGGPLAGELIDVLLPHERHVAFL